MPVQDEVRVLGAVLENNQIIKFLVEQENHEVRSFPVFTTPVDLPDPVTMPFTGTQTGTVRTNVFEIQPSSPGVGAFSVGVNGTVFSGTTDHVYDSGYNIRNVVSNEPSYSAATIEHDFNESGFHWLEAYDEYFGKTLPTNGTITNKTLLANVATLQTAAPHGLVVGNGVQVSGVDLTFDGNWTIASVPTSTTFTYVRTAPNVASVSSGGSLGRTVYRPSFIGISRSDGQLVRTQYLAGSGGFQVMDWATRAELLNVSSNGLAVNSSTLMVKSPVDRPQIVLQVGNTNDFVLSSDANYVASMRVNGGIVVSRFQAFPGWGGFLTIGTDSLVGKLTVKTENVASVAGAFIRGFSGQTADILGIYSEDDATIFSGFNRNGYPFVKKNVAPTDGELRNSELTSWFDNTNGAAKVMFKAKQADGTIRTASLAMV